MTDRLYLHETIDIIGANRAAYNHHMTANFGRIAREERGLLCVGVFSTVGSTERWPQTMNLWEFTGSWDGVAANFRHEFSRPQHQDASLEPWWAEAASYRSGGYDRLLIAAAHSPTLADLLANPQPAECHYHELVSLHPGAAPGYLALVADQRQTLATEFGWSTLGAWRTALVNDSEAILVWSVPTWEHWARWEEAQTPGAANHTGVAAWRERTSDLVVDWRSKLMVAYELSPVVTGQLL
jgi:hypothetical protein